MLFKKVNIHGDEQSDSMKILSESSTFAFRESHNSLCTNVLYLPITDKCKKIAVTSSVAGEGKTTVSINLSISLAENTEKKILLIDMDLRSPRVKALLKDFIADSSDNLNGVSEYLAGITDAPTIIPSKIKNLSFMFSGKIISNPAGLISSARMDDLLKITQEEFDYIIIDTPPLNIVTDAALISNKINGYIIAARADFSTINSISELENSLNSIGANVFGIVLTSYNSKRSKKYGKYYGK